jgi:hypothetical protein
VALHIIIGLYLFIPQCRLEVDNAFIRSKELRYKVSKSSTPLHCSLPFLHVVHVVFDRIHMPTLVITPLVDAEERLMRDRNLNTQIGPHDLVSDPPEEFRLFLLLEGGANPDNHPLQPSTLREP